MIKRGTIVWMWLRLVLMFSFCKFNATEGTSATNDGSELSWSGWSARVRNFSSQYWEFFKPYGIDIDLQDTESVKNFTSTIVKESTALMDDIQAYLEEHAGAVAGGRDSLLLMNLLDFYAGVYLHRFSRLIEVYYLMMAEIESSKQFGRQVHEYFFVANGFRIYFIKEEAKVEKFIRKMLTATKDNVFLPIAYDEGSNRRLDDLAHLLKIQTPVQKMDATRYYIRPSSRLGSCLSAVPGANGRLRLVVTTVATRPAPGDAVQHNATVSLHGGGQLHGSACLPFRFEGPRSGGRSGYSLTAEHRRQRYSLVLPSRGHRAALLPHRAPGAASAASVKCVTMSDGDALLLHWGAWRPMFLSIRSAATSAHPVPQPASTESSAEFSSSGAAENTDFVSRDHSSVDSFPSLFEKHSQYEVENVHARDDRTGNGKFNFSDDNSYFGARNSRSDTKFVNPIVEKVLRSTFLIRRNVRSDLASGNSTRNSNWLDEKLEVVFSTEYTGLFSQWILEKVP